MSSRKRPKTGAAGSARPRAAPRDPRFEDLCGKTDAAAASRNYGWLDDHEAAEIARGKAVLRTKRGGRDAALKADVEKRVVRRKQRKHDERKADVVRSLKKTERDAVKGGKAPYFAKKRVVKQALLEDRFSQLQKSGKLNGFLRKKARTGKSTLEAGALSKRTPRGAAASSS